MQIFNLSLACILSLGASDPERTFCVVFIVVIAGALLLTVNVVLLGGAVSLLQSVSLLGYCMFPLDIAALVCSFVRPPPLFLQQTQRVSIPSIPLRSMLFLPVLARHFSHAYLLSLRVE